MLRLHFPALRFLELPGYAIRYPSHSGLVPYLGLQIPGLLRSIRKEHDWLEQLLKQESFDQIISDNRYGLWHPAIASVILTHQLYLPLPTSMQWAKGLVQRRLHRWLNRSGRSGSRTIREERILVEDYRIRLRESSGRIYRSVIPI